MRIVIADVQGFIVDDIFYAKELAIKVGNQTSHYIFKSVKKFEDLSLQEKKSAFYLMNHHHGLKYSDGYVEYSELSKIVENCFMDNDIVYVVGHQKYQFLRHHLKNETIEVHNVENFGWTPLKIVKTSPKCMNHTLKKCICSLANCYEISKWVYNFLPV